MEDESNTWYTTLPHTKIEQILPYNKNMTTKEQTEYTQKQIQIQQQKLNAVNQENNEQTNTQNNPEQHNNQEKHNKEKKTTKKNS